MATAPVDNRDIDAFLVGSHCQYASCNQLDFLPFKCESCHKKFCSSHRTEDGHECTNKGAWGKQKREAALGTHYAGQGKPLRDRDYIPPKPCAYAPCETIIGTSRSPGVRCKKCKYHYCLKHRMHEEHSEKKVDEVRAALERFKRWAQARPFPTITGSKSTTGPKSKTAQIVAVNTLKKNAKGDAKIALEKRVYLFVEAQTEKEKAEAPKGQFFYNKDWVVGKMLDAAAKSLQVLNINNQTNKEEKRLRVFHVEGGRILEFNEKIGDVLQNGNTVVLMRGVGPPPDLMTP